MVQVNGISVWSAQIGVVWSDGDDALMRSHQYYNDYNTTGFPMLDHILQFAWANAGILLLVAVAVTVLLIIRSRAEVDYTNLYADHPDPHFQAEDGGEDPEMEYVNDGAVMQCLQTVTMNTANVINNT